MKIENRNSNFELMRIVSMLFIVIGHTLSWGGITSRTSGILTYLIYVIYALIVVHVNSFVLLTGYFQYKMNFKITKVLNLLILMLFYRFFFYIFSLLMGWKLLNWWSLFELLPLSNFSYWFLNMYIILYMFSPFLNKFIFSLSKNAYKLLLAIMFIFCSIVPRITLNSFINNDGGYSLIHFIFMYLLGAYLSKNVDDLGFFNKFKYKRKWLFFLFFYFVMAGLKYFINFCGFMLLTYCSNDILKSVGKYLSFSFENLIYDDPLVIIQSVCYFMFFCCISLKSRIINYIAKCVNEIYLFHMNLNIRTQIYLFFGLNLNYYTYRAIPMAFVIAIIIFLMGFIIYNLRKIFVYFLKKRIINYKLIKTIKCRLDSFDQKVNSI